MNSDFGGTNARQSRWTKILTVLILALSAVLLRQVWLSIQFFLDALKGSPDAVKASVIAASATVLAGVLTLSYNARYQSRREIEAEHRKQKAEIYEEFIKFMFGMLMREKLEKEPLTELEIMEFAVNFNQRMIVWGSDEVLQEWIKFREASQNSPANGSIALMKQIEGLLNAIRKDLGHKNKNLKEFDLLRLFINDIDTILNDVKMVA